MSGEEPSVVIAIPTRNSQATLAPTLQSAVDQTYPISKIIVVDNDSSDGTVALARSFAERDSRVDVIEFNELVSGEGNFNRCLQLAGDAKYVAVLHSDDVYGPEMIQRQVAFLETHPNSVAVFTHAGTIDEAGMVTGERLLPGELAESAESELSSNELFHLVLKYGNFLTCPSALMRPQVFWGRLKGWNGSEYGSSADLDLWLRASEAGKIGFLSAPLMSYRVSHWSFSVALSKTRVTPHPMLKVIGEQLERRRAERDSTIDSNDLWNWRFLQMKDAAFLKLNRLKLGSHPDEYPASAKSVGNTAPQMTTLDFFKALVRSRFHRRFALRIAAIEVMSFVSRMPGLQAPVRSLVSRVKIQ